MATVADLRQLVGDDAEPFELSDVDIARALVQANMSLYYGAVLLRELLQSRSAEDFGPAWKAETARLRAKYSAEQDAGVPGTPAEITLVDLDADTAIAKALIDAEVEAWAQKGNTTPIPADKLGLAPDDEGAWNHPRQLQGRHDLNVVVTPGVYQLPELDPEDGEHSNVPTGVNNRNSALLYVSYAGTEDDEQALRQEYVSLPAADAGEAGFCLKWERTADYTPTEPDQYRDVWDPWVSSGPTADWAVQGNTDLIPVSKLPTPHQAAGVNLAAVDAEISKKVRGDSLVGNTDPVPREKLTRAFDAISAHFPDWAFKDNLTRIPADKLPANVGNEGSLANPFFLDQDSVNLNDGLRAGFYVFNTNHTLTNAPDYHWVGNPPQRLILRQIWLGDGAQHQSFFVEGQWWWRQTDGANPWTDWRLVNDTVAWAQEGNTDQIPADKLGNAPAGGGGGLNQNQVDQRIRTLVDDWAEAGNAEGIPGVKLNNAWAQIEPNIQDFAQVSNAAIIPTDKLGNVRTYIADWGEAGNTTPIPASKLTNAPGGTTIAQVRAEIQDDVESWALDGNSDDIPAAKLEAAHAWIADWAETDSNASIPPYKDLPPIIRATGAVTLGGNFSNSIPFTDVADSLLVLKPPAVAPGTTTVPAILVAVNPPAGWQATCYVTHPTRIGIASAVTSVEINGYGTVPGTTPADAEADIPAGSLFMVSAKSGGGVTFTNLLPKSIKDDIAAWAHQGNTDDIPFSKLPLPDELEFTTYQALADNGRSLANGDTLQFRVTASRLASDKYLQYQTVQNKTIVITKNNVRLDFVENGPDDTKFFVWVFGSGCTWYASDGVTFKQGAAAQIPAGSIFEVTDPPQIGPHPMTVTRLFHQQTPKASYNYQSAGNQAAGSGNITFTDAIKTEAFRLWLNAGNAGPGGAEMVIVFTDSRTAPTARSVLTVPLQGGALKPPTGANVMNFDFMLGDATPSQLRGNAARVYVSGPTAATDPNIIRVYLQRGLPSGWNAELFIRTIGVTAVTG